MKTRITIGIAALAFGVALASVPAFAQHVGRNLNDGGLVDAPSAPATKTLYNTAAPAVPHFGKGLNDGGQVDQPSAAQLAAAHNISWAQNSPHYGKAMNDGGM
jgi:hypothetical protein